MLGVNSSFLPAQHQLMDFPHSPGLPVWPSLAVASVEALLWWPLSAWRLPDSRWSVSC